MHQQYTIARVLFARHISIFLQQTKEMKRITAFMLLVLVSVQLKAQDKISEAAFIKAFRQVVNDSYNNFKTTTGEKIAGTKDSFYCKIKLPGNSIGNVVNTFALSSFHAYYEFDDKQKADVFYRQLLPWAVKSYLPNKVAVKEDSSYNAVGTKFVSLTNTGFENWRTSIMKFKQKDKYKVAVYVSGISKRLFLFANKNGAIKDDALKTAVSKLFKEAINSNWEAITDTVAVDIEQLPCDLPFGMNKGTVYNSRLQLPNGKSYVYVEGQRATFIHLTPLSSKALESTGIKGKWIGKLCYSLPSHYVFEKKKKEEFLFMTIYPTEKFETLSYDGIEVILETSYANDKKIGEYIVTQFKLHNSSKIKL
jgi:hypothetical protein